VIGGELAIRWPGGQESYLSLEMVRRHCPCAACCGEPGLSAHSRSGDEVVARKFSVEGNAAGGRVCDSTDLGGWARNGNLFVGLFKKDLRVNT
jgi:DUF971 family protein